MGILNSLFGNGISEELQQKIQNRLANCIEPTSKQNINELKAVTEMQFKKGVLKLKVSLPYPCKSLWPSIEQNMSHELTQIDDVSVVEIDFETNIVTHDAQKNLTPLSGIKNIIAVASGKGGVGKSTTSVNLALALQQEGARVGLLDADIYGPSIPTMLNIQQKPETKDGKSMQPLEAYGLQVMSIGALIEEDSPYDLAWPDCHPNPTTTA